jgi:chromosome segregation ATPase
MGMQTMTTWKHRKKAAKRQKVLMIGLAIFTFLGGALPGYWWGSQHSQVPQLTSELERIRFDLAKTKFEQEQAAKTADIHTAKISEIHTNIEAVLFRIFDAYRKHSKIVEAAAKNVSKNKKDKTKQELEMMWESEFSPLQDRLTQLENTLSELENREPRDFDLPTPPSTMVREIKK